MYDQRMPILDNLRMCVNSRKPAGLKRKPTKVPFHVSLEYSFKNNHVPTQLKDLLVYIAREGVAVTDLFRRPGNPKDMKIILGDLQSGKRINWHDYNFYTLANVAKKFLLNIDGGLLGPESERQLIVSLNCPDDHKRTESMHNALMSQPKHIQQFIALLFGIWFRMIYHTEVNAMSVEAVAKSVAGSVFPNHCFTPQHVEEASKVMEYLITGFASPDLFGIELIEFFTSETQTSISRVEKYQYEFSYPVSIPKDVSMKFINKVLLRESHQYGFDLALNAVDKSTFDATNWAYKVSNPTSDTNSPSYSVKNSPSYRRHISDEKENQPHHSQTQISGPNYPVLASGDESFSRADATLTSSRTTTKKGHEVLVDSPHTRSTPLLVTMTTNAMTPRLQRHSSSASKHTASPMHEGSVDNTGSSEKRTKVDGNCTPTISSPQTAVPTHMKSIAMATNDTGSLIAVSGANSAPQPKMFSRATAGGYGSIRRRQMERLQKRADWFLSSSPGKRPSNGSPSRNYLDDALEGDRGTRIFQSHSCYDGFVGNQSSPRAQHGLDRELSVSDSQTKPQSSSDSKNLVDIRYFVIQRHYGTKSPEYDETQHPCPYHFQES